MYLSCYSCKSVNTCNNSTKFVTTIKNRHSIFVEKTNMVNYKIINGNKYFNTFEDAAEFLGCSVQTIRRYTDKRQQEERRMKVKAFKNKWGAYVGCYLPVSEAERFRDEIRPTFRLGGRDGRKKGAKDKQPRKKRAQIIDPLEIKLRYTPPSKRAKVFNAEHNKNLQKFGLIL